MRLGLWSSADILIWETHISEGHGTSPGFWDTDGELPTPGLEPGMWAGKKVL